MLLLLLPFLFSDFFNALHGLICDYKCYESVKKMFVLSLLKTVKSVDSVSRCRHCRPLDIVGDGFFSSLFLLLLPK